MVAFDPMLQDPISRVRYAVGDTGEPPLEPDATYQAVIDTHGEDLGVAVIAQSLATKYAQKPTTISVDEGSFTWNDRIRTWLTLSQQVRAAHGGAGTVLGGAFVATRQGDENRAEYVRATVLTAEWWTQ
jgi:hypothetical protein